MLPSAHAARTAVEVDGEDRHIFRRDVAHGGVTDHPTVLVGLARDQWRLTGMLRRMTGATDGIRDGLTGVPTPLSGACCTCPPIDAPARSAPPDED